MKTVVSTLDVFRLWANESQEQARNSRCSVSFAGPILRSYRTQIGQIVRNQEGKRAFLVNTSQYSVTTSCHQSAMLSVIPAGELVFRLHRDACSWLHKPEWVVPMMAEELQETALEWARARSPWRKEALATRYAREAENILRFAEFFSLEAPALPGLEECAEAAKAAAAQLRRERAAEAAAAKRQREEAASREASLAAETERNIPLWLAGEDVRIPVKPKRALLRVNWEEEVVETSSDYKLPILAVRREAYRIYQIAREAKVDCRLIKDEAFGHSVYAHPHGELKIGCHSFDFAEVERFARVLGVI